jgi:hypothetical protein
MSKLNSENPSPAVAAGFSAPAKPAVNTAVAAAVDSTVNAAAPAAPAEITTDPKDLDAVKEMLYSAFSEVTGQAKAELSAFVEAMAPTGAVCVALARAGDERAALALKAMRTTLLMTPGIYGIRLLQSSEQALLAAVNVGFKMILGPGGEIAGQAAIAAVGGIADAVAARGK